jgi:hypothetical protein
MYSSPRTTPDARRLALLCCLTSVGDGDVCVCLDISVREVDGAFCLYVTRALCSSNFKAASAYGKARADIRWTGHLSAKKEAKRNGCSTKTIYRRRKNGNCHVARKDADDFIFGDCSFSHQMAVYRQKRKDSFYKTHSHAIASLFAAMNATKTHKMPSGIPYHKLSQNKQQVGPVVTGHPGRIFAVMHNCCYSMW